MIFHGSAVPDVKPRVLQQLNSVEEDWEAVAGDHQWGQRLLGGPRRCANAFLGVLGKQAGCFLGQAQTPLERQLSYL